MIQEDLGGELGLVVLQGMTRSKRYVMATEEDISPQRAHIIRNVYARMYEQLQGLKGKDGMAYIESISPWLMTRVVDHGSGAAYVDIDEIERTTRNLLSLAIGNTETPLSSLADVDWLGLLREDADRTSIHAPSNHVL